MSEFSLDNPVFRIYLIAASLAVLKLLGHGLLTVHRMMAVRAGWASPEDLRPGPLNPHPDPSQLAVNDHVDRARRMHRNEVENTPPFLAAGLVFVAAAPPVWLAAITLYGYLLARLAHAWAYGTARSHEVRATFYTIGLLLTVVMCGYALVVALRA